MTMTAIDAQIDYSDQRERLEPPPPPFEIDFPGGVFCRVAQGYSSMWWVFGDSTCRIERGVACELSFDVARGIVQGGQHRRGGVQDVALFVSDY